MTEPTTLTEKFLIFIGVFAGYDEERVAYIHARYLLIIAALLIWKFV